MNGKTRSFHVINVMVLSSKTTAKIEVLLVKKIKGADLHHNGDSVTLLLQNYFGK